VEFDPKEPACAAARGGKKKRKLCGAQGSFEGKEEKEGGGREKKESGKREKKRSNFRIHVGEGEKKEKISSLKKRGERIFGSAEEGGGKGGQVGLKTGCL